MNINSNIEYEKVIKKSISNSLDFYKDYIFNVIVRIMY
jgi:hypothetical protein